jgi:L-fuculose-phosphate aldolase
LINEKIVKLLSNISLALFRKNFFGIYHGSISTKIDHNHFVINTKDTIFDEIKVANLCELEMNTVDYSWKLASMEANIHNVIYSQIHEAKYIACGMSPYTTAYTLEHDEIIFKDFFGKTIFEQLSIHDPGDYKTWYERNQIELPMLLKISKNNIVIIKGVGIYVYDRDINELVKKIAILENSCRLLSLKTTF